MRIGRRPPCALGVPRIERGEHAARARERVRRVPGTRVRHSERRQQGVTDELLETAAISEDLFLHSTVEGAEQGHHFLGRHLLGERGEADEVREEHADRLAPHAA